MYEKFLNEQLLHFVNHSLSDPMSAYRIGHSTNHVSIRLNENWRKTLDNNLFTGVVLMDLSKAFDFIPHDPLIAKLHAYDLGFDTVTFRFTSFYKNKRHQLITPQAFCK